MNLRLPKIPLFALLFSLGMLAGAYAFQYVGGLEPCQMCYWQRWAHWGVAGIAAVGLWLGGSRSWPWVIALALLVSAGVAGFHAGVEYGWWEGPKSCSAAADIDVRTIDPSALLGALDAEIGPVDCSKPAWTLLGLSMAGWNALLSFAAFCLVALAAARRNPR